MTAILKMSIDVGACCSKTDGLRSSQKGAKTASSVFKTLAVKLSDPGPAMAWQRDSPRLHTELVTNQDKLSVVMLSGKETLVIIASEVLQSTMQPDEQRKTNFDILEIFLKKDFNSI